MSYDRAEFASSKFVNAMGIRRMYSLLERIFDRSAHLPTISIARQMLLMLLMVKKQWVFYKIIVKFVSTRMDRRSQPSSHRYTHHRYTHRRYTPKGKQRTQLSRRKTFLVVDQKKYFLFYKISKNYWCAKKILVIWYDRIYVCMFIPYNHILAVPTYDHIV